MASESRKTGRGLHRPLLARLDLLCSLAGDVASLRSGKAALRKIVDTAVEVVGVPVAHLALVDRERKVVFGVISSGRHGSGAPRARYELQPGLGAEIALRTRRPVVIHDARSDRRVNARARVRLRIGSILYVPMLGGGQAFGLLILTYPRPHRWSRQQVRLATYAAGVASVGIQTTRLLERLALSEGRFRHLLEDIPAIVYTCEVDWPYRSHYVSPQAEAVLGYPAEEWISDPDLFFRLVHPDDVAQIVADADEAIHGQGYARSEYRMLDREGNTRWFRDEAVLVRDPAGRPVAWHGVVIEVRRPSRERRAS